MTKIYLTPQGKKDLEEKLEYYKTVRRPEITKKIGEAREFGDLSENAEYDAAKNEQALIEHEISEMETKLRDCVVINKNKNAIKNFSQLDISAFKVIFFLFNYIKHVKKYIITKHINNVLFKVTGKSGIVPKYSIKII